GRPGGGSSSRFETSSRLGERGRDERAPRASAATAGGKPPGQQVGRGPRRDQRRERGGGPLTGGEDNASPGKIRRRGGASPPERNNVKTPREISLADMRMPEPGRIAERKSRVLQDLREFREGLKEWLPQRARDTAKEIAVAQTDVTLRMTKEKMAAL